MNHPYALAFEEFMIPCEIKVSRDHAFLVAYPESYAVVVETTNPVKGISGVIDQRKKQKFLENLVNLKLISKQTGSPGPVILKRFLF
ncbi:MAG: hypothetical protein U5Q03_05210 [Bacteroidota bacterium]|nr:hypothetical protein [Bacteroidota bacterium]